MSQEKTKKCKFCQSEIDAKARVCPVCKRPLKNGHGCLIGLLAFIIIACVGVAAAVNLNDNTQKAISGVEDPSEYITLDEYNKIDTGMTYDEVREIVGSDGTVSSQVEMNGYNVVIITWYGNGLAGSNANVTFTNDSVSAKAQVGLQ